MEPDWRYDRVEHWRMLYGNITSFQLLKRTLLATIAPWYYLGQVAIAEEKIKQKEKQQLNHFFKYFQAVLANP